MKTTKIEFNMNYIGPHPKKWVPHKIAGGPYREDFSGDGEDKPVVAEFEIYNECVVVVGGECYSLEDKNHFFMKFDNVSNKWIPYKNQNDKLPIADPCSQQGTKTTMDIRIGSQWVRIGGRWYKIG